VPTIAERSRAIVLAILAAALVGLVGAALPAWTVWSIDYRGADGRSRMLWTAARAIPSARRELDSDIRLAELHAWNAVRAAVLVLAMAGAAVWAYRARREADLRPIIVADCELDRLTFFKRAGILLKRGLARTRPKPGHRSIVVRPGRTVAGDPPDRPVAIKHRLDPPAPERGTTND